jgi:chitin biosynthesis protein CHS5
MDRQFKFPQSAVSSTSDASSSGQQAAMTRNSADGGISRVDDGTEEVELTAANVVSPSSVEVLPPPPIEKERSATNHDDVEEDVGETEEISLN